MTEETARPARSRAHKVIGGVCGGFGRHYHLDPVIFRVPLAVLSVIGGLGFVAYGVAWLLIPFEGEEENEGRRLLSGRVEGPGLTALLSIVAGCGLMLASLGEQGEAAAWFSTMVVAAMAGAAYWSRHRPEANAGEGGAGADLRAVSVAVEAPPEAQPPPTPQGPSWWRGAGEGPGGAGRARGYLWGPASARPGDFLPAPVERAPDVEWEPRVRPPRRPGRGMGMLVMLLAVAACAVGTVLAWQRSDALGDAATVGLSCALTVFGFGLVVSAFAGRLGAGTVGAVVLTCALLAGAVALPKDITTSWSEPRWRPASATGVAPVYEVGSGHAVLDLGALELAAGESVTTRVAAGMGEIDVIVPARVDLTVSTSMGVGAFEYDGRTDDRGSGLRDTWGGINQKRTVSYAPEPVSGGARGSDAGTIELLLEIDLGQVTVDRAEGGP